MGRVVPVVPRYPPPAPPAPCLPAVGAGLPVSGGRAGPSPCPCPCRRDRHPGRLGPRCPGGPGPEGAAAGGVRRGPAHGPPRARLAAGCGHPGPAGAGAGAGCPGRPVARRARGAGAHGRHKRPRRPARGSWAATRGTWALGAAPRRALPPPPPLPPRTARPARGRGRGRGRGWGRWLGFPRPSPPSPSPPEGDRRSAGGRGAGTNHRAPFRRLSPPAPGTPTAPLWESRDPKTPPPKVSKSRSCPDASACGPRRPLHSIEDLTSLPDLPNRSHVPFRRTRCQEVPSLRKPLKRSPQSGAPPN